MNKHDVIKLLRDCFLWLKEFNNLLVKDKSRMHMGDNMPKYSLEDVDLVSIPVKKLSKYILLLIGCYDGALYTPSPLTDDANEESTKQVINEIKRYLCKCDGKYKNAKIILNKR